MKRRTKYGLGAIVVAAAFALLTSSAGCHSTRLPPRISPQQKAAIVAAHFRATVGVERSQYPVYSESLLKALRHSGLFDRVDRLEDLKQPPDLVARVEGLISGTAGLPCATFLTLGIVPTTVDESWGYSFSLSHPANHDEKIPVEYRYTAPSTLGWASLFKSLSPDVIMSDPKVHPRFREGLASEIVAKSGQIYALLKKTAPPN